MNTTLKSKLQNKVQALADAEPVAETSTSVTALNPTENSYLALRSNALDVIQASLKNQPLSLDIFDTVKSPTGGSTVFSVPSAAGDEAARELTGIIVGYTTPRAYWDTPDPVEGTLPTCASPNSIVSASGKNCATCPFNEFGSRGDGISLAKACRESVLLFLLREDNILPLLIRIPVTSKTRFLQYVARLVGTLTPIHGVVTRITLSKATSRGGKPYARYNFETLSTLSAEETARAKEYGRKFMDLVQNAQSVQASTPPLAQAS